MQKPEIQSIDHIVMQAADLAATIKFYTEILGMDHSSFQPPTGGASAPVFAFRIAKDQFA
jgi:catechol 2,3-dioxygenase-like lactoylglutathione lyase family enzyme